MHNTLVCCFKVKITVTKKYWEFLTLRHLCWVQTERDTRQSNSRLPWTSNKIVTGSADIYLLEVYFYYGSCGSFSAPYRRHLPRFHVRRSSCCVAWPWLASQPHHPSSQDAVKHITVVIMDCHIKYLQLQATVLCFNVKNLLEVFILRWILIVNYMQHIQFSAVHTRRV